MALRLDLDGVDLLGAFLGLLDRDGFLDVFPFEQLHAIVQELDVLETLVHGLFDTGLFLLGEGVALRDVDLLVELGLADLGVSVLSVEADVHI